jgi:O-antigen/teichoic acid export membrane protein
MWILKKLPINKTAMAVGLSSTESIIRLGSGALAVVVASRLLPIQTFAAYGLAFAATQIPGYVFREGLWLGAMRGLARTNPNSDGPNTAYTAICGFVTAAMLCVGVWLWALGGNHDLGVCLIALAIIPSLDAARFLAEAHVSSKLDFGKLTAATIAASIVSLSIVICFVLLKMPLIATLSQPICWNIGRMLIIKRQASGEGGAWDFRGAWISLVEARSIIAIGACYLMISRMDQVYLSSRSGLHVAGIYIGAQRLISVYNDIILLSVARVAIPVFTKSEEMLVPGSPNFKLIVFTSIPFMAALGATWGAADLLLPAVLGPKWLGTGLLFRILLGWLGVSFFSYLIQVFISVRGKGHLRLLQIAIVTATSWAIILCLPLATAVGVASGLAIGAAVGLVVGAFFCQRQRLGDMYALAPKLMIGAFVAAITAFCSHVLCSVLPIRIDIVKVIFAMGLSGAAGLVLGLPLYGEFRFEVRRLISSRFRAKSIAGDFSV